MKSIALILASTLILPLSAQNPRPRQPIPPAPQPGYPAQAAPEDPALTRNITIRLAGTTTTGSGIDLELTGTGPSFSAQQVVGEDQSILSCDYQVKESGGNYLVSYSIGMRIKVVTASHKETVNYEYRDVTINGSALCQPNKAVVLVRNSGKPLELLVSPGEAAPAKAPAAPTPAPEPGH
ncbi:hypothetical protein OJ996_24225 [Luteolibacter sp. GHJ8]|uniref:Uncharacterized protein n=1 Tax=Luteolibacter rhizosphaerae TaxID=2989719 RepID=A0ABT3GA51_9BACT|nr:hypothetical protein [Luteolibacter rhizosphaerae]MCW1916716.1 hypothetical protein [Luteolibacter rhizosphaerae]